MPDAPAAGEPGSPRRQMHLAAFVEGVNHTTVWRDPAAGDQMAFASFRHAAQTAERGLFDFFFLGQGLRMREQRGELFELDIAGRPDSFAMLAALSEVTDRIGLAATVNTTFYEPAELARSFGTLDHLSGGRAAWNVVTSSDAFTGGNFRRGGYLPYADRYVRAQEVLAACAALWAPAPAAASFTGRYVGLRGEPAIPPPPQGRPVLIQAGDSPDGRDFGVAVADVVFSRHSGRDEGIAFRRDIDARATAAGRDPRSVLVLPIARIVLGETGRDAAERAREIGFAQIGPERALSFAEQVWGRDLHDWDPDGPLPDVEPYVPDTPVMQGRVQSKADPRATVAAWRARAERDGHTLRSLMVEIYARPTFVGSPKEVATEMAARFDAGACDGYVLSTHLMPTGLDDVVAEVVPLLQRSGHFRSSYPGGTLRDLLFAGAA
ncbi:LLM class flavin-dependent oxidoreductase [Phytohabitans sp. ZYX-F-186]|uniref:LLM class flavin-dependent oxidoreductase n=1 Tax=Phytohabitans maris TaxID=3071409 RepID=A0ABU0ZDL2_9ACTN|nr:LLM class flavin-dependent oxidoreductase [Phytohabitans sp. ZYX-F-186]MDQ7905128.1 LLM class flavin-dependent oxidoreductase [Phytohabitans sp. ZYX-F-186]